MVRKSRYWSRERDDPRYSRDRRRYDDSHPYVRRRERSRDRTSSSPSPRYGRIRSRSPRRSHQDIYRSSRSRYGGPRPRHDNRTSRRSKSGSPSRQRHHESPGSVISLGSPVGRSTPVYHSEFQSSPREPKAGSTNSPISVNNLISTNLTNN